MESDKHKPNNDPQNNKTIHWNNRLSKRNTQTKQSYVEIMSVNGEMFAKSPCDECAAHLIMISFKISKRSEFAQTFVLSENKLKKK